MTTIGKTWWIAASVFAVSGAYGAEPADGAAAVDVSEVVVTGSRIRGVEAVGSAVVTLDREVLTESTGKTAMEIVSSLPQLLNFGVNEQTLTSTSGTSNALRSSSINLHGVNQAATLVLFNGRRGSPMGTNGGFTDPSYIPTIALDRVEVIADGASAIYGADAVAGVVNFMTRRKFDGFETRVRRGWADGYNTEQYAAIGGFGWSTGHVMAAFERVENSPLSGTERDFIHSDLRSEGGNDFRASTCTPGNLIVGGVPYALPAGGVTQATASRLVANSRNFCENYRNFDFSAQQRRNSAYFYANQALTERFTVFAETYYSSREFETDHTTSGSSSQIATLTVPSTNPFYVTPVGVTPALCAASVGAPAGTRCVSVEYDFRTDFGGLYHAGGLVRTAGGTLGGTLDLGGSWQAELTYTTAKDRDLFRAPVVNATALSTALLSSNPAAAFNPFAPGTSSPAVIASLTDGIFQPEGINRLELFELRADGPVFTLPAGEVRLAAGASRQYVSVWSPTFRGTTAGVTGPVAVGDRNIRAGYAELFVPLVGGDIARPGIRKLALSLAGRIDDYSDVGKTTNPKVGVTWQVLQGLTFKGSYGSSFRAPNLTDITLSRPGSGILYGSFPDPAGGTATGFTYSTGNPDLSPETAKTYSFGVEVVPTALDGLKVGATYWSIKFKNQVQAFTAVSTVLSDPVFADRVQRNPSQAVIDSYLNQPLPITGIRPPTISYILDGRPRNQGATNASGIDIDSSYRWPTERLGEFRAALVGTYYLDYDTRTNLVDPFVDRLNTINNPTRVRARASFGWRVKSFNTSLYVNHVGSYTNTGVTPNQKIDRSTTLDLHLDYGFGNTGMDWLENVNLAFDVTNLADSDPPFVNVQGGYDPVQASAVGRLAAVTLALKF